MIYVRAVICLVIMMFGSGVVAQGISEPVPCFTVASASEAITAATNRNGWSVIWVHRQGKDFPPCASGLPLKAPYWIINRADNNRRFYVFAHDALRSVYSTSTRRSNFVTLDELTRGIDNMTPESQSQGNHFSAITFATNVYSAEQNLVMKLACSGTLAGLLLALGLWQRGNKWGLLAARSAAGCPLALYAGGTPGFILPMLIIPWIVTAFVPARLTLAITTLVVVIDQLLGTRLGDYSPLQGYFSSGIRFYGVGNEILGIITGTLAVCVSRRFRFTVALGCIYFFGNASLGADFGAVVTFAALAALDVFKGIPHIQKLGRPSLLLGATGVGITAALAAAFIDLAISPTMSHAGAALATSGKTGIGHLAEIVGRKLLMNLEIAVRPPTLVAVTAITGLITAGRKLIALRKPSQSSVHYMIFAVALSFLFNDSGVVTAMMALLPALAMIPEVTQSSD